MDEKESDRTEGRQPIPGLVLRYFVSNVFRRLLKR